MEAPTLPLSEKQSTPDFFFFFFQGVIETAARVKGAPKGYIYLVNKMNFAVQGSQEIQMWSFENY